MAGGPTIAHAWIGLTPTLAGSSKAIQAELGAVDTTTAGKAAGARFSSGFKIGVLAMGVAVAVGIKSAISEASNLNESLNAVQVTFGNNSDAVKDLGKNAAKTLGLSNNEFNGLAVQFSAFTKTIAGDGGDVVGTLKSITGRASDFASVMNLDVSEAARLFQSGLAGESEPLRRYGIDISEAAVQTFAYANGIAASGAALTATQKVQARYGLIMAATSANQGDFANTSNDLANGSRILAAQVKDLSAQLGAALLPVMKKLVTWGLQTVEWIRANKDMMKPAAIIAGVLAVALWALISPWTLLAVAIAGVAAGLTWFFMKTEVGQKILSAYVTAVKAYAGAFVWLWKNGIKPAVDGIVTGWKWLWDNVIKATVAAAKVAFSAIAKAATWLWTNGIKPTIDFAVAAFKVLAGVVTWLWQNIFSPIIGFIGASVSWLWNTILKPVVDFIVAAFKVWGTVMSWLWDTIIRPMIGFLGEDILWLWNSAIKPVIDFIGTAWDWLWKNAISPVIAFIMAGVHTLGAVFSWLYEHGVKPAVALIMTAWDGLKTAFAAVKDFFSDKVQQIKAIFSGIADAISGAFKGAFNGISRQWNKTVGSLEFTLPKWLPGSLSGAHFDMPDMPILDTGAIVTKPTIAMLAANSRPEAIVPLDKWDETVGSSSRGGDTWNLYEVVSAEETAQAVAARQRSHAA